MTTKQPTPSSPVLDAVRMRRTERDHADVALLTSVLDWAIEHTVEREDSATYYEFGHDTGLRLAGNGAPCVGEFDTYELAAALGMTSESGKKYLGRALELRYRLPRVHARVIAGDLPVWRAGTIADHTICLPEDGATFVDRMLAPTAHKSSYAQLDRLIEEALIRFDPDETERRRVAAEEHRHFDVYTHQSRFEGTVEVAGTLDLADALNLDAAITHTARDLKAAGCEQSLDVRRSMAAGELARHQLALDLTAPDVEPVETPRPGTDRPRRPGHLTGFRRGTSHPRTLGRGPCSTFAHHASPLVPRALAVRSTASTSTSDCGITTACSPTAPNRPDAATPTTSPRTRSARRPIPTISHRCAVLITGRRPTPRGTITR